MQEARNVGRLTVSSPQHPEPAEISKSAVKGHSSFPCYGHRKLPTPSLEECRHICALTATRRPSSRGVPHGWQPVVCAGINRRGVVNERGTQERNSDPS